ncbi:MAG TPA: response regulator [Solirubrobacteraceae bacterium]
MPARILVIEDNESNLQLVDILLTAHGFSSLLARNGADGVRIAIEERPDMVLLDIRMPGMDGYEVASLLRQEATLSRTRIVALTASAMLGDRERIAAAEFDGYIQKPIDPGGFIAEIQEHLPEPSWEPPPVRDRESGKDPQRLNDSSANP